MRREIMPEIFSVSPDDPIGPLARQARAAGRRLVGTTCAGVPEPLLSGLGLVPVRLRAPGVKVTPLADAYLGPTTCTYVRGILELSMRGRLDDIDGWVFAAGCDHLRRLHDNLEHLGRAGFTAMVDVPHRRGEAALEWYRQELENLAEDLAGRFHVSVDEREIESAIKTHNACAGILRSIAGLGKRERPPLTGAERCRLMLACSRAPADMVLEPLEELAKNLESREGEGGPAARLVIAGCRVDDPAFIDDIEKAGGLVVADLCCPGFGARAEPVDTSGRAGVMDALAAHGLEKITCPRMMEEQPRRAAELIDAARRYGANGVVVQTLKMCDLWGVESSLTAKALRAAGIPVLKLEREYAASGEGQLATRIQAFVESLDT
jgi:benzoyl-CoA reductase/2-hydroxyglutaryl-CoA dehydratase subunit BcrC/BadD/HgdB